VLVFGAVLETGGIWVVTGSVVWVVVISVQSTVGDSVVEVINEASLLLKMVIIRVNITISVEQTIVDIEHVRLKNILVFEKVLALMRKHVSVLHPEVLGQSNIHLWCIVVVSVKTVSGEGLNVVRVVTQSVVKWRILTVQGIALSVLNGVEGALSVSQASTSGGTFTMRTWI